MTSPWKAAAAVVSAVLALSMLGVSIGASVDSTASKKSSLSTLTGDDNDQRAWNYLKERGFSDAAAAGILGNWKWESSGGGVCDPTSCQDGSKYDDYPEEYVENGVMGYGIGQWTSPGRSRGLVDYAKSVGLHSGDLQAQLGWFWEEVNNGYEGVLGLKDETDVDYACTEFQGIYEGAGIIALDKRLAAAHDAYDRFHGTAGGGKKGSGGCSSSTVAASAEQAKAVEYARSKAGCAYVGGACGPNEFDCSGLVCWAFRQAGYDIPRVTADGYWRMCEQITEADLEPGDLVFWDDGWVNDGETMGHVAIYEGDGKVVQAVSVKYGVVDGWTIEQSMSSGNVYYGRLPK